MRRFVGAVAIAAAVVLVAGCGATDWSARDSSAKTGTPAKSSKSSKSKNALQTAARSAAAERTLIDAMVARGTAHSTDLRNTPTLIRCIATAVVHTYGAPAFSAAGITANALRDPETNLDSLADPTDAQVAALGSALQHCDKINALMAAELANKLHVNDNATVLCLAGRFGTADARRFLALSAIGRHVDLLAAHGLIGILAACVDLPSMLLDMAGVPLDNPLRPCLLDEFKAEGPRVKDVMALTIAGDTDAVEKNQEALAVSLNHCRASAHTGFTVPNG